tara:strand:+ start:306 stop:824 length:519 start_codon:yes stop_codon:yes gene_type:complete
MGIGSDLIDEAWVLFGDRLTDGGDLSGETQPCKVCDGSGDLPDAAFPEIVSFQCHFCGGAGITKKDMREMTPVEAIKKFMRENKPNASLIDMKVVSLVRPKEAYEVIILIDQKTPGSGPKDGDIVHYSVRVEPNGEAASYSGMYKPYGKHIHKRIDALEESIASYKKRGSHV